MASPRHPQTEGKRKRSSSTIDQVPGPSKKLKPSASESGIHSPRPTATVAKRPLGPSKSVATIPTRQSYTWDTGFPRIEHIHLEHPQNLDDALGRLVEGLSDDEPKFVAFDMEWIFNRTTQREGRVALIQLASESLVVVYGPSMDPQTLFPQSLTDLLVREDIIKVGNRIEGDLEKIHKDFTHLPNQFQSILDLSRLTRNIDPNPWRGLNRVFIIALNSLAAEYLNMDVNGKHGSGVRYSDWEARGTKFKPEQLDYASADVTVSLHLVKKLIAIGTEKLQQFELSSFLSNFPVARQSSNEWINCRLKRGVDISDD